MSYRIEIENQLVHEIHYLPTEAMETLLKLALMIKQNQPTKTLVKTDNFAEFIRNSPLMNTEIELERNQSMCRDIEL